MDAIQKVLIEQGRKDLAQEYYNRVAKYHELHKNSKVVIADMPKGEFIGYYKLDKSITKAYQEGSYINTYNPITSKFEGRINITDFKSTWKKMTKELYDVFSLRNNKKVKWNKEPLLKAQAEDLMKDLKKSTIPSVDTNSIEMKEASKEPPQDKSLKGFVTNIEEDTTKNTNFRKVLYTGKNSQLVLMSLKPKEDIGDEIHDVDQFFRIDSGSGKVIINGKEHKVSDGFAFVIPAGAKHNVINDGTENLKLYSIYSPPHHVDGIVHKTKAEALADKTDKYEGKTTE